MPDLTDRLRADLRAAMGARDRETVRVLRIVLAAVGNAEAQPAEDAGPASLRSSGPIAGASGGLGAADVPRRLLSQEEVRAVVRAERDDLVAAGREADAAVLDAYLG